MCEVLDKIEARGIEIGEIRGTIAAMHYYMNKTPEEISEITGISEKEVKDIIEKLKGRGFLYNKKH